MAVAKELLVRFKGDTKGIVDASNRAEKAVTGFGGRVRAASVGIANSFKGMTASFAPLIGALSAFQAINVADDFKLLSARIENATQSSDEFRASFLGLQKVSAQTGVSLGAAVEVFQRLSFSRAEIDATAEEMVQFTGTVQKLGVVSGASTQALQAGLTQLGQGLSSGVLRAEEFNSILENIPAVGKAIADGFGVTVGQLRGLVLEGEVLSKDVFDVLLSQSGQINEEFEKFPMTVGRAFATMKLEIFNFIGATDEASSATNGIVNVIEFATDRLREMRLTANLIPPAFQLIGAQIQQTINNAAVAFQNFIIKVRLGIEEISMGLIKFEQLDIGVFQRDFSNDIEAAKEKISGITKEMAKLGQQSQETTMDSKVDIDALREKYGQLAESVTGDTESIKKAQKEAAQSAKDQLKAYQDVIEETRKKQQDMGNEIGDTLFEIGRGYTSLRDVALKALDDILRSMFRLANGGTSTGGIFGDIGGAIFGSIFGGGGSGGNYNPAVSPPPMKPSFASGGSFQVKGNSGIDRNTLSLNGQPIANVSKGETVGVSRAGGGTVVNIINNSGAQAREERSNRGGQETIDVIIENIVSSKINTAGSRINRSLQQFSSLEATRR